MSEVEVEKASATGSHFACTTSEDCEKLLKNAIPRNTKSSTTQWTKVFEFYCHKKEVQVDFATIELEDLVNLFESFYADIRKKKMVKSTEGTLFYRADQRYIVN